MILRASFTSVFALAVVSAFPLRAADQRQGKEKAKVEKGTVEGKPAGSVPGAPGAPGLPAVPGPVEAPPKGSALSLLRQIDEGFVELFEKMAPSVVVIDALKKAPPSDEADEAENFEFFFKDGKKGEVDKKGEGAGKVPKPFRLPQAGVRAEGSGFILRADGYIVTNYHVVADVEKIKVRLRDGRILPGQIVGVDDKTDIAVLKIEARDLVFAELGDSEKLRVGQLVCAIGAPFNQDYSFTCGWVSGKGRTNLLGSHSNTILYEDYIQTDAFINPGNSGGPLFDVNGQVVGMNTLINGLGRGLAFAIPSNMIGEIANQLITTGRVQRPWLGIRIESLSDQVELQEHLKTDQGIVVRTIEANAPAYRSDLRPADVIREIDGVKLLTAHDLQKEVLKKRVGQVIQLLVMRGPTLMKVAVTTGELPVELPKVSPPDPHPAAAGAKTDFLGLRLQDQNKAVVVLEVRPDSAADRAEIQPQDVITEINGKPVENAANALKLLEARDPKAKKGLMLNIERKGKRTFALLETDK